jgi:voltage-gated potassium channel
LPYTSHLVLPKGRQSFISRWLKVLRAVWRDSSALWQEFRVPILIFLAATLLGGYVYGELYYQARGERIPYIDLPYNMMQLMTFQGVPEQETPPEPQLAIFWYIMPLIGIYVIGRGATDFFRLFFDRSERRDAWEEAVASTYRNHVIILGIGHVGLRVTRALAQMGFEIVAIDQKATQAVDDELSDLGVPLILGDGRLPATLDKAGLRYAQSFIIATSNDFLNLEVTMRARDMNPDIRIVVRMWENDFAQQLSRFMGVKAVLSASDLAAPAFAGAAIGIEITQTLTIKGEDYSMIRLQVEPGSFLDGGTIDKLQMQNKMDIVLHAREGHDVTVHPADNIRVQAGDTLVIFSQHRRIIEIVSRNRPDGAQR